MTNQACLGYAINAMKNLGYTTEEINEVIKAMLSEMDLLTEGQAEKAYRNF